MQKPTIIKSNEKTLWLNLQTLVKFYNLHLQSKKLSSGDKEKLRKFLEMLSPEFARYNAQDAWLDEHGLKLVMRWHMICEIINAYRENRLGIGHLVWLQTYLREFIPTLLLERRGPPSKSLGREYAEIFLFGKQLKGERITLKTWQPAWGIIEVEMTQEARMAWGINERIRDLENVFKNLAEGIYLLLRVRWPVKQCAFPRCKNIFIPHPQAPTLGNLVQKYCPACKKRRKPLSLVQ